MSLPPKSVLVVVSMIIKQSGDGFSLLRNSVHMKEGEVLSDSDTDELCDFRHTI